ncbi:oxidoreductase [Cryobacterium sp. TMT1-21]|uniref:Oxidoreductase n=1 Tax=Cryobacterium shii TaxID=1259235 RepID=A0AAQ2C4D3_9MICO|nr:MULTISPECIES: Gfo/Idh/MocA family oxidoreductase [Cryobacterium]TFC42559.1 oxidoreductase [Cryobacterium shii]TFC80891.1 oxidoreductase [Cryobacterium sp. TmT2-59]TFD13182.1 oxidoreductase [Cryobacterium sp. TMT1-21]TFD28404.1 oxidoreductase [Cryobacterium sp. TMT2-23]TFD36673.1 oxidoreductase [Cryobacterium sp. TMT2-10]
MPQFQPATAPIRTGLIGFGTSGRVFHSPLLAANPDFSLDLIVTRDPARLNAAATRYPQARLVPTVEDLFAAADDLDLVVIGSPSATHVELANAALDAGLAVVVDKPFAVKPWEGRDLIEKARRLGLLLTVFQNRRWDGDFLTLRALLAEGALGEVRRFESRFEWWKPEQTKSWKVGATIQQGGGVLFDLGAHLIDQALQLFGPVDDVYAETLTRRPGGAADDDTFVALHHGSGVRSHLWMNGIAAQVGPRFRVLGSESGYTKWGLDGQETALAAGASPTDPDFGVDPESAWGMLGRDGALTRVPTERGAYGAFYSGLADALLRGGPVPVDPEDALRVINVIERVNLLTH